MSAPMSPSSRHSPSSSRTKGPAGFAVGASTGRFEARLEQEWWPPLRQKYQDATTQDLLLDDRRLLDIIFHPPTAPEAILPDYPSHLHIDILPRQQAGRRLIETLFDAFAAKGSPGVHLFVGARNDRAIAFYRRIGLTEFSREPWSIAMCRTLT